MRSVVTGASGLSRGSRREAPEPPGDGGSCTTADGERLVPSEVALAHARSLAARAGGRETVLLDQGTGRITAEEVRAPLPLPLFDNAAMDGYGLDPSTLCGAGPWRIAVAGRVRAGDAPGACPKGAALRILTGAAIPAGVTAVVPQEDVRRLGDGILLDRRPPFGAHIRRAGSDLDRGAVILPAGRLIGPREAAALAAAGHADVAVRPRLRVALLSTGSELVAPGAPLAPGRIWDANAAQLAAALSVPWIALTRHGSEADAPGRLRAVVVQAAAEADLVVTSGGVSVGDEDHMARVMADAGGTVRVMQLAMKPGKPFAVGRLGKALWIGLPGNPVAAFVSWMILGAPIARAMAGLAETMPMTVRARLGEAVAHKRGRCEYRLAMRTPLAEAEPLQVSCLPGAGSHRTAQLAAAEGLVRIPADAGDLPTGAPVDFLPFRCLHGTA